MLKQEITIKRQNYIIFSTTHWSALWPVSGHFILTPDRSFELTSPLLLLAGLEPVLCDPTGLFMLVSTSGLGKWSNLLCSWMILFCPLPNVNFSRTYNLSNFTSITVLIRAFSLDTGLQKSFLKCFLPVPVALQPCRIPQYLLMLQNTWALSLPTKPQSQY